MVSNSNKQGAKGARNSAMCESDSAMSDDNGDDKGEILTK